MPRQKLPIALDRIFVRWMIKTDVVSVLAIEATAAHPWNEEDLRTALRAQNCIGMIAEMQDRPGMPLAGFMVYELNKTNLEIINLAVAPELRRIGVGRTLVNKVKGKVGLRNEDGAVRRNSVRTVLRESNLDAQLFFRSQGFMATEFWRGYFEDSGEDGYLMEYFSE